MSATQNVVVTNEQIEALKAKGLTAESDASTIKKAYFGTLGKTAPKVAVEQIGAILRGELQAVEQVEAPAAPVVTQVTKTSKPKAEKKAAEPKAPKAEKAVESDEALLARLKQENPTRYGKVTQILERGKKGPTRVRILCEDKGANGEDLFRDIKIQDLFQVRFSAGYASKASKEARAKRAADRRAEKKAASAPATEASAPASAA